MSPKATRSLPVGTALITGATAGLGLEFAQQLARSGHPLVLVARNPERLDQVARQLGEKYSVAVTTMSADLTQRADVDRVAERISSSEEPIAILVNNAGHGL
ncbi:MAG TPA: SDR family NAD(P)-dependent oxidoreductase, partial [Marmoricola sp.]|nr:SDR family NAD(P)-dependent oxidoreductase [Marmoricola sp.]